MRTDRLRTLGALLIAVVLGVLVLCWTLLQLVGILFSGIFSEKG